MNLSANSLFHFTNKIEYLTNILEDSLHPRYCLETYNHIYVDKDIELAIPMICFCDIPLSSMQDHTNQYGQYGIGLTKEWGINNGLSPILYLNNNSFSQKCLYNTFETVLRHDQIVTQIKNSFPNETKEITISHESLHTLSFIFLTKPYMGNILKGEELTKSVIFYNEREWRYIPLNYLLNPKESTVFGREILESNQEIKNASIRKHKLEFTAADIKYIIISNETEREGLLKHIDSINPDRFNTSEKAILKSKVLSIELLYQDF